MYIRFGITRIVIKVGGYVVKVPSIRYGWRSFLRGIVGNMDEWYIWRTSLVLDEDEYQRGLLGGLDNYFGEYCRFSDLLCPVVWCSPLGFILIMRYADVDRHMQEEEDCSYTNWVNTFYSGDCKPANFGYYKDRLVKVDYA